MIKKKLNSVYNFLFLAFVFTIPFEDYFNAVPNILLGVMVFLCLFLISKKQLIGFLKNKSIIAFVALVFFVYTVSLVRSTMDQDLFFLNKIIILLVVILLAIPVKDKKIIQYTLISSTFIAATYSLYNISMYILANNSFDFMQGEYITEMLVSERLYIGFCAALSIIFSLNIIQETKSKKIKWTLVIVSFILVFFVFLIVARIALLAIIFALFMFIFTKHGLKKRLIYTSIFILFASVFAVSNKNITDRFLHSHDVYRKGLMEKIIKHEPRIIIWGCSYSILYNNHNLFFGNGFAKVKEQLVVCYKNIIEKEAKRNWFVNSRFNTHNQFLDFLLSAGIIGLIIFLTFFYFLFKESKKDFFAITTIGALLLILLIDNIMHRQIGGYLFGLITILVLDGHLKRQETISQLH